MDPSYPAFPILAFIAFLLVLVPLPWHLQAWNSGTCLFMMWIAIELLNLFINSIVWRDNVTDWAPVFCDISTRITLAASVGINASSLCISRRLYKIAVSQNAATTPRDKRRELCIDLAIGLGLPLLQLPLHYVVNGHRYDIYEEAGCRLVTYNTALAYPLVFLWPNVLCFISIVFCLLTLRAFLRRRAQFAQFLSASPGINPNRYFRLMALASVEILVNIPISSWGLYNNLTRSKVQPWVSWEDTHYDWNRIGLAPAFAWRSSSLLVINIELQRWSTVFIALVFFGFFGFSQDGMKRYRAICHRLGLISKKSPKTLQLPLYSSARKPKRSNSEASSTVIGSPTTKLGSEGGIFYLESKGSNSVDSTWADESESPTWPAVPAPRPLSTVTSMAVTLSRPSTPTDSDSDIALSPTGSSMHTMPSLGAVPDPPSPEGSRQPQSPRSLVQVTSTPTIDQHFIHLPEPERAMSRDVRPFSTHL